MSQEQEKAPQSDSLLDKGTPPLTAMRGGWSGWTRWSEAEHTRTDIRECTDQHCMSVDVNVGFQGLDPTSPLSQAAAVSNNLRDAWKAKLDSEGKATTATKSLRDVVFGSEQAQS